MGAARRDRFYNLVKNGFYDDARFFRAISGFMVQFGINGDPAVSAAWRSARIGVDPVKQSNKPDVHHVRDAPKKCSSPAVRRGIRRRLLGQAWIDKERARLTDTIQGLAQEDEQ